MTTRLTDNQIANATVKSTDLDSNTINVDGVSFGPQGIDIVAGANVTVTPDQDNFKVTIDVNGSAAGMEFKHKDFIGDNAAVIFVLSDTLMKANSEEVFINGVAQNRGANNLFIPDKDYSVGTWNGSLFVPSLTGDGVNPLAIKLDAAPKIGETILVNYTKAFVGGDTNTVIIKDEGLLQGTASVIDFTGGAVTATVSSGVANIHLTGVEAGVNSINSASGDITIAPGTNIYLDQVGPVITINASGAGNLVSDINSITGSVSLTGGDNIVITNPTSGVIQIAASGVITDINGQLGPNITISGGTNIGITNPSANVIQINSTAPSGGNGRIYFTKVIKKGSNDGSADFYTSEYVSDNAALQAAVDSFSTPGKLLVREGIFEWDNSAPVLLPGDFALEGLGDSTVFTYRDPLIHQSTVIKSGGQNTSDAVSGVPGSYDSFIVVGPDPNTGEPMHFFLAGNDFDFNDPNIDWYATADQPNMGDTYYIRFYQSTGSGFFGSKPGTTNNIRLANFKVIDNSTITSRAIELDKCFSNFELDRVHFIGEHLDAGATFLVIFTDDNAPPYRKDFKLNYCVFERGISPSINIVGMYFEGATDAIIGNNIIDRCGVSFYKITNPSERNKFFNNSFTIMSNTNGIFIAGGAKGVIATNTLTPASGATSTTGIVVTQLGADNNLISGNKIDTETGVRIEALATRTVVHGNNFSDSTTLNEIVDGGSDTLERDNVDYTGTAWLPDQP